MRGKSGKRKAESGNVVSGSSRRQEAHSIPTRPPGKRSEPFDRAQGVPRDPPAPCGLRRASLGCYVRLGRVLGPNARPKAWLGVLLILMLMLLGPATLSAQTNNLPVPLPITLNVGLNGAGQGPDVDVAIQVLLVI